jgi:hypothetical protein
MTINFDGWVDPVPEIVTIAVDVIPCDDGIVELSFECPWGCSTGRGRNKRPKRHNHGGGFVGQAVSLGHRESHCERHKQGYLLVPGNVPVGYKADPDDPFALIFDPQAQRNHFAGQVELARQELERLTAEVPFFQRNARQVAAIKRAEDALHKAQCALRASERLAGTTPM